MEAVTFNDLGSQKVLRSPASFYARLREHEPLTPFTFGAIKIWLVATTYDETALLLKDPRFVRDIHHVFPEGIPPALQQFIQQGGETLQLLSQNMLSLDPPDHTRLRGLVSKAFTPRMIEQLRPRIQQIADELLDAVQARGQMDLVADFAYPLPMSVISEMLGIPPEDRAQFRSLTQALLAGAMTPDQKWQTTGESFISYIKKQLAARREKPGDDLMSNLLQAREQDDMLTEDELVSMIWLLIVAGHETTVNLLSNGALALLLFPEQLRLLRTNPGLIPSAVEELLRLTAPVLFASKRMAREDLTLHDQLIHRGDVIYISTAAANTDPEKFSDPQNLDVSRQENRHLIFGKGIHSCLGAPLARLEGQIAFSTLLARLPNLRLACEPESLEWNPLFNLRSLKSLPVSF
ncbi:cytochrome P450 [Ktedonosporobacter rubrisoli]|uniref:Cytochrome P450 n=1 Tax=Ktedonosporobacter rubrisoli TaxID=2509675 RepID=A0A4V0YZ15_KTERU|nr:cytochrome P450 [Ktedonosporobacter rubrisoli]QBD78141.1 cytochrome P450 [Ktedonosporobacter rubrisoli]